MAEVAAPPSTVARPAPVSKALGCPPGQASFTFSFSYVTVKDRTGEEDETAARKVSVPVEVRGLSCGGDEAGVGAAAPAPVLIFSSGFLTPAAAYGTLLQQLAAAGCVVVSYDKSFETLSYLMDDNDSVRLLAEVWRRAAELLAGRQGQQQQQAVGPVFLVGHSRGAKVSVLAAAAAAAAPASAAEAYAVATADRRGLVGIFGDVLVEGGDEASSPRSQASRQQSTTTAPESPQHTSAAAASSAQLPLPLPLAGVVLLDPADGAFEPQDAARYPSALAAVAATPPRVGVSAAASATSEAPASSGADAGVGTAGGIAPLLPALVVGAGRGGDCVPRAKNFRAFYEAWPGPRVLVTLPDAGHLQFMDTSDRLAQSMCAAGRGVANAQVAAAAAAATVAFVRGVVAATAATTPIGAGVGVGVDVGAGGGAGGGGKGWESGGGRGGLGAVELRGLCERALEGATVLRFGVEAAVP